MKPARWALSSLALLLSLLGGGDPLAADVVQQLEAAQILLSEATEPPPDSAPWQAQTLPDNWSVSRPKVHGYGWYRMRFELAPVAYEPYAAYLPWLRTIGAVDVNGVLVRGTGEFGKPRPGPRPQYFEIPARLLHAGINTLHI